MAQIINPAIMDELRFLAAPLAKAAQSHADEITSNDPSATSDPDAIASAEQITALSTAMSALLQCFPMTQAGVVVALGAVTGTVLGQCDGDRTLLYDMFKHQTAATLAEIVAARMPAVGTA